jgi:hypothetical protein
MIRLIHIVYARKKYVFREKIWVTTRSTNLRLEPNRSRVPPASFKPSIFIVSGEHNRLLPHHHFFHVLAWAFRRFLVSGLPSLRIQPVNDNLFF